LTAPVTLTAEKTLEEPQTTPEWEPDQSATYCPLCKVTFIYPFRRKHHCRKCGRIFCDSCSKKNLPLPRLGYDRPVRVCNDCYKDFKQIQTSQRKDEITQLPE